MQNKDFGDRIQEIILFLRRVICWPHFGRQNQDLAARILNVLDSPKNNKKTNLILLNPIQMWKHAGFTGHFCEWETNAVKQTFSMWFTDTSRRKQSSNHSITSRHSNTITPMKRKTNMFFFFFFFTKEKHTYYFHGWTWEADSLTRQQDGIIQWRTSMYKLQQIKAHQETHLNQLDELRHPINPCDGPALSLPPFTSHHMQTSLTSGNFTGAESWSLTLARLFKGTDRKEENIKKKTKKNEQNKTLVPGLLCWTSNQGHRVQREDGAGHGSHAFERE